MSNTNTLIERDRQTTAELLAHLAEVDERKLYLAAAFPSMYAWCEHKMHLTEDAALRRIQAARVARRFPAIFPALADGRLHLTAIGLLAPYLNENSACGLLKAAAHKTKAEILLLLAERFPQSESLPLIEAIPVACCAAGGEIALAQLGRAKTQQNEHALAHVENIGDFARVVPAASQRFALHLSIGQELHADLVYAQELLSHQIAPGDLAGVIGQALKALIREAEKAKFAATDRPQQVLRRNKSARHIPNRVKREVWKRDGGRCTFVSEDGYRCESRTLIEYDHVEEVARGGRATVTGIRLRCRAHNQFTAEQTFGREFMDSKRDEARRAAEARRKLAAMRVQATERAREQDVTPWLRALGIRADEARRAAQLCDAIPDAPLEERIKFAPSSRASRISRTFSPGAAAP